MLQVVKLPAEAPKIDRLMECFADVYKKQNPNYPYSKGNQITTQF